jgi:hypothetical protein
LCYGKRRRAEKSGCFRDKNYRRLKNKAKDEGYPNEGIFIKFSFENTFIASHIERMKKLRNAQNEKAHCSSDRIRKASYQGSGLYSS